MAETTTLDAAVTAAVKDNPPKSETQETTQTTQTTTETTQVEDKTKQTQESEGDGLDLDDVERVQAAQLFAALKDPTKAPVVLKFLAEQAGYIKTEKQAATAKDDVMSVLKEHLGPEFEVIADRLGPAIDKIVDKKLREGQASINQRLAQQEEAKLQTEADLAMSDIAKEFYDAKELPDDMVAAMNKAMDEIPPTPSMTVERYMRLIFKTVAFDKGITAKVDVSRRVERNRNDAPSRLASERAISPGEAEKVQGKMSLSDSVKAAVEKVNQEMK